MADVLVFEKNDGTIGVFTPAPGFTAADGIATIPGDALSNEVLDDTALPADKTFRNAWRRTGPGVIEEDLIEAKKVTHERRRKAREDKFFPHDKVVALGVPGEDATAAEAARVVIRADDDAMQIAIDAATAPGELKTLITTEGI